MSYMKIVFLLGALQSQRCIKRISPFVERGVETVVYAFNRSSETFNSEVGFPIEIIGSFSNDLSYAKRLPILVRAFRKVAASSADLYYLFGMDMALMFRFFCPGRPFVYEESDMVHTYLSNSLVRKLMESLDKRLMRKSRMTVLTSEGFLRYHFGEKSPGNVCVIPNKLSSMVVDYPIVDKSRHGNLRIGFVGKIRFRTVFSFAYTFCRHYPQHEFHFYGSFVSELDRKMFEPLKKLNNCFFHGSFKNPSDLPSIYAEIDWLLSSYDTNYENVRYAEPNKLYEAIYFETPIIVSEDTFLAEKVKSWNIGLSVNATDESEVVSLVDGLSNEIYQDKLARLRSISKSSVIDQPDAWVDMVLSV